MIKIGLIGCGFMGTMHANCYKTLDNVEVVAVADIRNDKAKILANLSKAEIYSTGKELIEKAQVDAIDICLPTYMHSEYALLAMDKVKYLFIEKPIALSVQQAESIIKKQKETDCNIEVGQVIRFWDEYMMLKKIYDNKEYGNVINASFRRLSPRPTWGWNDWLLNSELSGGAAEDLHVHDMDYMIYLFGKPEKTNTIFNKQGEKYSYVNTICEYKDFSVSVEGTWDLPSTYSFEAYYRVVFEKAVVEYSKGKLSIYTNQNVIEPKIEKINIESNMKEGNIADLGGYINELDYFTKCIKNNKKIEKATACDATESLKFIFKERGKE